MEIPEDISQADFCKLAMEQKTRPAADALVAAMARLRELDPNFLRWFILDWIEKNAPRQLQQAREFYEPEMIGTAH